MSGFLEVLTIPSACMTTFNTTNVVHVEKILHWLGVGKRIQITAG